MMDQYLKTILPQSVLHQRQQQAVLETAACKCRSPDPGLPGNPDTGFHDQVCKPLMEIIGELFRILSKKPPAHQRGK